MAREARGRSSTVTRRSRAAPGAPRTARRTRPSVLIDGPVYDGRQPRGHRILARPPRRPDMSVMQDRPGPGAADQPRMRPTDIYNHLREDVLGQEEVLRFVSVAIFKHVAGERYGNLLLI